MLEWTGDDGPEVLYQDDSVTLRARMSLDAPYSDVFVGVGADTLLETDSEWSAWLAAESWAPLRHGARFEIVASEEAPFRTARLTAGAPAARRAPPTEGNTRPRGQWRELSDQDEPALHATPADEASRWTVPLDALLRRRSVTRGWVEYDVWIDGVIVRGYSRVDLGLRRTRARAPTRALHATVSPWCAGLSSLDGRVVPSGTELLGPPPSLAVIGHTRRAMIARRVAPNVVELRAHGARHWVVRTHVALDLDAVEPATVQWDPDPETCVHPPPW